MTDATANPLQPITDWFTRQSWSPFAFQHDVWTAYLRGESGLIHSPTGSGKTYAAWLGPVAAWLAENPAPHREQATRDRRSRTRKRNSAPPLQVLWITPLRALAADTAASLQAPIADLGLEWTIETRTGDTSSSARNRQRTKLPTALITTPESLSLLLARPNAEELFASLQAVIVDEWHELMATKRGVQTELALARLRRWHPGLHIWGLSATMGNLEVALRTLIGTADYATGEIREGQLVQGDMTKQLTFESMIPPTVERFPWAGHLGLKLLPQVIEQIEANRTTLVFTNTRNQTERWYQEILARREGWAGEIALHHSSLDPATRSWVENELRNGRLRCVVCTSSLDLGVDFPAVDCVLQVGSPKGVARLMQRAGRSGHQPGATSRVICVPTHALELLEVSAARLAMQEGQIEERQPLDKPLDVLVQHLVTVGLGGGFDTDELYREVRTSHAYRSLTPDEWLWALDFVSNGGAALHNYDQYRRVINHNGRYFVEDKTIGQMHRMSIGTIVGDAMLQVQYLSGGKLGQVEESFASRLKTGDRFTLAGKVLEFVRLREMKVWVRRATGHKGIIPRWAGGRLPISDELAEAMREKMEAARQGCYVDDEMRALIPLFRVQQEWSTIPALHELLIEVTKTREGHHLFVYPFAGRLVHEGLAALTAYRLGRRQPITFTIAANDYGFELLAPDPAPLTEALDNGLFAVDNLLEDILQSLNAAEMAKRQFREIARVAGLVIQRFPGGQKTTRQLQASSSLIYDVLQDYDKENLLLAQAQREVLQRQLEESRLQQALDRIAAGVITVKAVKRPTPFAFPLLVDRMRQTITSETLEDRIRKMQLRYEKWAGDE
ncbi:MAG: ligase-associated DNA damage response DEXH box helicase [Caldilineaceae bacterium]